MTRLRFVGDAAVRVDVTAASPLEANRRVRQAGAAMRAAAIPGVRDVVPGMTTLTVHVDPLRTDLPALEAVVADALAQPVSDAGTGRQHDVPVVYGGSGGPDLDAVAHLAGLTTDEVIAAHVATAYEVCFLGFLPGFAYLGLVPDALRIARRPTPRTQVPAGSVALAEVFTGIYPAASPGGWHVIGRTSLPLVDLAWSDPVRFAPGDRVRFVEA